MRNIRFSIIIPTYNRADMIAETIESVINQTHYDWELILIDDGSTDNTKEVVSKFIKQDLRIRYVFQENAERSVARNNGIQNAKGDWICFLDSDDLFASNHLEGIHKFIHINNIKTGLLFTGFVQKNNDTTVSCPNNVETHKMQDYFFRNPVNPTRVCLKAEIAKTHNFREDAIIVEDTLYWIEVSQKYKVYPINQNTAIYNVHKDNSINIKNNAYQQLLNGINNFKRNKRTVFNSISPNVRNEVISEIYFGIAKYQILNNKRGNCFIFIMKSLATDMRHKQNKHRILILFYLLFKSRGSLLKIMNV